ncbi:iron-containing alcohol dehydrogenase, partial [Brucella abortus]
MNAPTTFADSVTVPVSLGDRSYDILIGKGLVERAGEEVAKRLKGVRVAIVTDENVAAVHLERLQASFARAGIDSTPVIVAPGEKSKSFATLETVTNAILVAKLERGDAVVALGGG